MKEITLKEFTDKVNKLNLESEQIPDDFKIDYRKHAHIKNNLGLKKIINYKIAKEIVKNMICIAEDVIGECSYDLDPHMEGLRTASFSLKSCAQSFVDDMNMSQDADEELRDKAELERLESEEWKKYKAEHADECECEELEEWGF